jgi:CrcB protein
MSAALPWATMWAVALGASIGAVLRWAAGVWLNSAWHGFPLGTLVVNCAGGFMIGVALISFQRWPSELPRAFVITGFLGGLTTFSAFSGESLNLLQRGQMFMAVLHAAAHVFGALACVAAGFALARLLLRA